MRLASKEQPKMKINLNVGKSPVCTDSAESITKKNLQKKKEESSQKRLTRMRKNTRFTGHGPGQ